MVTIAACSYSMILMLLVILYILLLYVDLENKDSLRVYCDVTTQWTRNASTVLLIESFDSSKHWRTVQPPFKMGFYIPSITVWDTNTKTFTMNLCWPTIMSLMRQHVMTTIRKAGSSKSFQTKAGRLCSARRGTSNRKKSHTRNSQTLKRCWPHQTTHR